MEESKKTFKETLTCPVAMDFSEKDQDSTRPPEYCYLANARAIIVAIEYQTAIVGSGRPKLW